MSQESSLMQSAHSVRQVLTANTGRTMKRIARDEFRRRIEAMLKAEAANRHSDKPPSR
jgi:hypothetical protein